VTSGLVLVALRKEEAGPKGPASFVTAACAAEVRPAGGDANDRFRHIDIRGHAVNYS